MPASKESLAVTARKWCKLIRANRERFTPRSQVLEAVLNYLPMAEVVELTGLTIEEIEKYRGKGK